MKKLIIISSFAAFLLFGAASSFNSVNAQNKTEMKKTTTEVYYTCKMHPEVHADKPGKCPKCGMKLEKKVITTKETVKTDSTYVKQTKTTKY